MDPTHDLSPARGATPSPGGELVVQNGRLAGTRCSLSMPLTFVGKAASCDVRLNVDGVNPLHCLIAHGPTGALLRDLDSDHGTFVNGQRVTLCPVRDGDLLTVGPVQFRVELPAAPPTAAPEPGHQGEKDALRTQAAAVAAQQAALAEEEARLRERRATLEQQENQLAAHLEEKRRRLMQVAEHAQAARAALQTERLDYQKHVERVTSDLGEAQRDLLAAQQKAQAERQRFIDLRRRFKQRWHRQFTAERKALRQRAEAVAADRRSLEKQGERLQQEKAALTQARLRFNGESELAKRRVQADRDALRQEQAAWNERRAREHSELAARAAAAAEREAALLDGERVLGDERYRWERARDFMKKEIEGLDNRIRNQRYKIGEQQAAIVALEGCLAGLRRAAEAGAAAVPLPVVQSIPPEAVPVTVVSGPPADAAAEPAADAPPAEPGTALAIPQAALAPVPPEPPAEDRGREVLARLEEALAEREGCLRDAERLLQRRAGLLEKLADDLADQRRILVEHWERLALVHDGWHRGRVAALADLEAFSADLPVQEAALVARRQAVLGAEKDLRHRHEEAIHVRQHLEGWSARLRLRESNWESERDRLLVDLRTREELADRRLGNLIEVRQRWAKRRRQELDLLRSERAACERLRQECAVLRDDLWKRGNTVEEERRALAEKTLALEQYRQEYVLRSEDAAATERRIDRLRRRWEAQNAELVKATIAERRALHEEITRLNDLHTALHKHAESVAVREVNLTQRQTAWEEAQSLAEAQQGRLRQELQSLQGQRDRYALHLVELQDEVERIARLLLDEPELGLLPTAHAA